MKRIDLHYGNHLYSVGGRELADMQAEIELLMDNGGWLVVNDGEGTRRDSYLWISPGVPLSLIPIPDPLP
ncbi:hypothetical protein ACPW96_22185 [Micromonospora sp. DT81.3]|uniref:hypothetical protein n=1 Tax=Micromonospora sp. DT81.3 TaxID=3416523 RepID=UPI003CE6EC41